MAEQANPSLRTSVTVRTEESWLIIRLRQQCFYFMYGMPPCGFLDFFCSKFATPIETWLRQAEQAAAIFSQLPRLVLQFFMETLRLSLYHFFRPLSSIQKFIFEWWSFINGQYAQLIWIKPAQHCMDACHASPTRYLLHLWPYLAVSFVNGLHYKEESKK